MAARHAFRSYLWRVGLLLSLLLAHESRGLAAPQPRIPVRRASHKGPHRVQQGGKASWYGPKLQGKRTASGQRFDQRQLTAAHRTLPLGTRAKVTNLETGQAVQVKITDRGPHTKGRIIDLSRAAAHRIGLKHDGTTHVRVEAKPLSPGAQTVMAPHGRLTKAQKKRV